MDTEIVAIEKAKLCLDMQESFLLQGGAGSGKTEALKDLLQYMEIKSPDEKLVCITHTNLAVEEIVSRIGELYTVSTIHSFLQSLIKDFKINLKAVIHELHIIPTIERGVVEGYSSEKEYIKQEYENYKKLYKKFCGKLYRIKKEEYNAVVGKKDYDINYLRLNKELNEAISSLNLYIIEIIKSKEHNNIKYNNTKFNSFKDLTYGHDGLLDLFVLLYKKYPLLGKMIADKYNYVLIDEYQDTRPDIVESFLEISQKYENFCVCFFGDSMQAIYKDGVGSIEKFVRNEQIKFIPKEDNYRCSVQVLDMINKLRFDDIEQKVAFKIKKDKTIETMEDRQGNVNFYYRIIDKKPGTWSSQEEKSAHLDNLNELIEIAKKETNISKTLILTNKAIAKEAGFKNLYNIFDMRYLDVGDHIETILTRLMAFELGQMCYEYSQRNYNSLIEKITNNGFKLLCIKDKKKIKEFIDELISGSISIKDAVSKAIEKEFLIPSESYKFYNESMELFLKNCSENIEYQSFVKKVNSGEYTYAKMKKSVPDLNEEKFNELNYMLTREKFYNGLNSDDLKFKEVYNYITYLNEKMDYITMHKTKGSSIESVLVVLDEYFWVSEYNFKSIYDGTDVNDLRRAKSQKLFYVACSRARKNLSCVHLVEREFEHKFIEIFPFAVLK